MKRVLIILLSVLLILLISFSAAAETVYVLCQPDSFVNVRQFPNKRSEVAGRVELGDQLETDGQRRNGFVHVFGTFESDAWISAGFVTSDQVTVKRLETEIVSKGRVACRRSVKGARRKWAKNGQKVIIYAFSDGWCVTDQGFIQTRFLGVF